MADFPIPQTGRKKALIVVDTQPSFVTPSNMHIIPRILELIEREPYDAYVDVSFHAEDGSLWDVQQEFKCPEGPLTQTCRPVADALAPHEPIKIVKTGRSAFAGEPALAPLLRERGIEEVHIVGLETHDCVLATAHGAFDNGFLPFAIEECCSAGAPNDLHGAGIKLLREQKMTNRSVRDDIE